MREQMEWAWSKHLARLLVRDSCSPTQKFQAQCSPVVCSQSLSSFCSLVNFELESGSWYHHHHPPSIASCSIVDLTIERMSIQLGSNWAMSMKAQAQVSRRWTRQISFTFLHRHLTLIHYKWPTSTHNATLHIHTHSSSQHLPSAETKH